jgi:hypothetical protein
MKQDELFFYLKKEYEGGNDKFFSVADLEAIDDFKNIYNVRTILVKLYAYGYLDINITDVRRYRVKSKYLNISVDVKSPLSPDLSYAEFCKLFKEE